MSEELRTLRQLLERQLAALAWNDYTRREPLKARALSDLTGLGVARDVAMQIVDALPADLGAEAAQRAHLELLAQSHRGLCIACHGARRTRADRRRLAPARPRMIAKLALRYVLEHGNDSLSIVTIDDEHIGAAEQRAILGRLLGVPSFRFASGTEFAARVGAFREPATGADRYAGTGR